MEGSKRQIRKAAREELLETFFEVEPLDKDQFLKVKETLTRIGLPSRSTGSQQSTLWQSCHILHKQGRYFICHFKQLFMLDGKYDSTDFTDEDEDRTEYVVALLDEWGLVKSMFDVIKPKVNVIVIPFSQKKKWNLMAKYRIGSINKGDLR